MDKLYNLHNHYKLWILTPNSRCEKGTLDECKRHESALCFNKKCSSAAEAALP